MKKIIFQTSIALLIIIQAMTTSSCSMSDVELTRSVFIEDKLSPGLPIYSEWGYNTFGAYIDRIPFVSGSQEPAKIYVNTDTLRFFLKGHYENSNLSIIFSIKGIAPNEYNELTLLNDTIIQLKDSNCQVEMNIGGVDNKMTLIDGALYFKRAQLLYVDKEVMKSILSGEFRFRTFIKGEPTAISNGRFDVGIGYENFYKF